MATIFASCTAASSIRGELHRIRRAKAAPRSVAVPAFPKDDNTLVRANLYSGLPSRARGGLLRHRRVHRAPTLVASDAAKEDGEVELSDGATLDHKAELSAVVKFAVPLLATNIVTPLLTMTDTAFVGRCAADSVIQLAALGVSTPLTDYTVSLAAFIPAGLTNIISNGIARGEGKTSLASKTYGALIVSITLSTIVTIILNVWPEQLLTMLKTPPEVMATAIEYTRIRSIAMPAAYLTAAAYAVLVARKDTTSPLACVCVAAVVNVVLDWIAVGVMGKGAAGAAWATTALCMMQISPPSLNRRQIGASVSGARPNAGFRIPNASADWTPKTLTRRR